MTFLIHHIRKLILIFSFLLGVGIYLFAVKTINLQSLLQIRLAEYYALTATFFLYFALLATPLYSVFPNLPYRPLYIRARRAIGVSAFFFALTHATIAFFLLLGGFGGLAFLDSSYLLAITFSFSALLILSLMASTSFDFMVQKLGTKWKKIHRLVYLAVLFITIHALLIGTNFSDYSTLIPRVSLIALSFLLILESIRFDRYLIKKFALSPRFNLSLIVVVILITYFANLVFLPGASSSASFNIHAAHQQLAQQAQQSAANTTSSIPSLNGDKTRRYTVSFFSPDQINPGETTSLSFRVNDASNGSPIFLFRRYYEKPIHLIVVDDSLTYFNHIHPVQNQDLFTIETSFPKDGTYRLYLDFQPVGAIEQQVAFTVKVGSGEVTASTQKVDSNFTKTFGDLEVTLDTHGGLNTGDMTLGKEKLSFTIRDAKTKSPITNLKPYLNTFGHLVMINQKTYDYVHVHPYDLTTPLPNANFGPTVDFLPIGIYGPFKAGTYRAFGQFNHNGQLFVADFTIKVK